MVDKTVAWIEDEADYIDPLMTPLRRAGITVNEYMSYTDALYHIDPIRNADLILLDLLLPRGSYRVPDDYLDGRFGTDSDDLGIVLLRVIRKEFRITLPVVALSIVANTHDQELLSLNAVSLEKPIHLHELRNAVLEALGLQAG